MKTLKSICFFISLFLYSTYCNTVQAQDQTVYYKNNAALWHMLDGVLNHTTQRKIVIDSINIKEKEIIFMNYTFKDNVFSAEPVTLSLDSIDYMDKSSLFSSRHHMLKGAANLFSIGYLGGFTGTLILGAIFSPMTELMFNVFMGGFLVWNAAVIYNELRKSKILHIYTKSGQVYHIFAGWKTRKIYRTLMQKIYH